MEYKNRDHRCWRKKRETEKTPRKLMYNDDTGQIYEDNYTVCKEPKCNKFEILTDKIPVHP